MVQILEVAPDIYRIESILGPRPFAQYLLRDERTMLVDTGVAETPREVILPALQSVDVTPSQLGFVLNTHADVDHFGGNAAVRAAAPGAIFAAHVADVPWIEDRERILQERYGWYAAHDLDYAPETATWLQEAMGPAVPIDLQLTGGERFRLGPRLTVAVLHLPGHSPGHLGLWEPVSRTAIVTDAVLAAGLYDNAGNIISPPPYFDVAAYETTVRLLQGLAPQRLLTGHYTVLEGEEAARFLAESAAFVDRARQVVTEALDEAGELNLRRLFETANPQLGPFTAMENELAGPLRAHLEEMVLAGQAEPVEEGGPTWRAVR